MKEERNRILEGMIAWKERERKIAELFSPEAIRTIDFQKEKLRFMYELRNSLGGFMTKEEQSMLRILKGEIKRLEKELYPFILMRAWVKLDHVRQNLFRPSQRIAIKKEPQKKIMPEPKMKPAPLLQKKRINGSKTKGLGL